jgi:hypothetical protein
LSVGRRVDCHRKRHYQQVGWREPIYVILCLWGVWAELDRHV